MPALNIFEDDTFGVIQLTKSINEQPAVPGLIGQMGLFNESGISTTSAWIERVGEHLELVPAGERGDVGHNVNGDKRNAFPVAPVHLSQTAAILADEVQNVRAFGTESEVQTVQGAVNQRLAKMRRRLDATIEYQRIGALRGQILDADGATVLVDLLKLFGIEQTTMAMGLGTDATKVLSKILSAKRLGEDKLGNAFATGWLTLCSASYFDAFTQHKAVLDAYNFYQAQVKSKDMRSGFEFGDVTWKEYRGQVGGKLFIPDGKALMVPLGVPELFTTNYAPADYMETVNTLGLPYYAKQALKRFNKGVDIEAQSNPIHFCARPAAVIELSI